MFLRAFANSLRRSIHVSRNLRRFNSSDRTVSSIDNNVLKCSTNTLSKIDAKMLIGFTCKVCENRSNHTMSKHSYTKGTVIIQCPGCKKRHLIADHLNWFDSDHRHGKRTIEEILEARGETIRRSLSDGEALEFVSKENI